MSQNAKTHTLHYLLLLLIFSASAFLFFSFQFDRLVQLFIILATAFIYFLWGLIHHYLEGNLYFKVVIEYFIIALLGTLVLISINPRG